MQMVRFKEYKLSRLMLGTVQFGLNYGIANKAGQPTPKDVREMLAYAIKNGVNCLDTAAAYGCSEEVIGRALAELDAAGRVTVVTKVCTIADGLGAGEADRLVEESVRRSLQRLRLDVLPVCLFHMDRNFCYMDSLLKARDKGLVRHVGVSAGNLPGPVVKMLASRKIEAMQIPTNMLDLRHLKAGVFGDAGRAGIAVFVRSVYLQGLIMMPEADFFAEIRPLLPVRRKLEALARDAGLTMAEMALRYVLSIDGVTCVLTGVESIRQLSENVALFSKGPIEPSLVRAIIDAVPEMPEKALTPPMWPQELIMKSK
jgi:aryl-alcohol dehydrogenase-like predicted oxidoreductase